MSRLQRIYHNIRSDFRKLRYLLLERAYITSRRKRNIVDEFHSLYYNSQAFGKGPTSTFWCGVRTYKLPLDLWIYQEIIHETKPDIIIETGTANGGSALYLAHLCQLMQKGRVISVDIRPDSQRPRHDLISYITGSSTDLDTLRQVREQIGPDDSIMVILDSDHRMHHVLEELRLYAPLVTAGQYLIVEDTNVNGHPVNKEHGPGPMEAVSEFLRNEPGFSTDHSREKFFLTFNPRGYLVKRSR